MTTPGASDGVKVVRLRFYSCRFDQPMLKRLIEVVRDPTATPQMELSATWRGTRFKQDDLTAIREAIERSFDPSDPRRLDDLRIETQGGNRGVVVELREEVATAVIESLEPAWALGKAEQLRIIFRHAGGKRRRWRPWLYAVTSGAGVVGVLGVLWMFGVMTPAAQGLALIISVAAAGFLIARWMVTKSRSIIWIDGPLPRRGWREWSISDRIACVALFVAAFAAVVPLLVG